MMIGGISGRRATEHLWYWGTGLETQKLEPRCQGMLYRLYNEKALC